MTVALLTFGLTLITAALVSELASRSILSTAVLFLAVGYLASDTVFGLVHVSTGDEYVSEVVAITLFVTLYGDGMRTRVATIKASSGTAARALVIGMPLTILGTALAGVSLLALPWRDGLLLGAVLGPTDPVLANALIGNKRVPAQLRGLLNLESGLNDGLGLPAVLILLHVNQDNPMRAFAVPAAIGIGIGALVMWLAYRLERLPVLGAHESFLAMASVGIAMVTYALCRILGGNEFLGAFACGVTGASLHSEISKPFTAFVDDLGSLFKFAALFIFGALLSPGVMRNWNLVTFLFAIVALVVVRPLVMMGVMIGTPLSIRERLAAGWFGPRGFASVLFSLMVLRSQVAGKERIFAVAALVIVISIVAHSSTDVPIAQYLATGSARGPARLHQ